MDNIYSFVRKSLKYIYLEKQKEWINCIVKEYMNEEINALVIVRSMKMLDDGISSIEVLDYIYSTRLDIDLILKIIDTIFRFYINGPKFMRDIYSIYITDDLELEIKKIEEENKIYHKIRM